MHALRDLFTSDDGLMSAIGRGVMIGIAVFFLRFFLQHMDEDAERAAARPVRLNR